MSTTVTTTVIPGDYQYRALHDGWRFQRAWHRMRLEAARHLLQPLGAMRVLDAGCGSGIMLDVFARGGVQLSGVDNNPLCIEYCGQLLAAHRPRLVLGEVNATGMAPSSVDLVLCCEVLEHLPPGKVVAALRHFHDLLAPGGHLFVTVPNGRSAWVVLEWMLDRSRLVPLLSGHQHIGCHTRATLAAAITDAGFAMQRMGTFNMLSPFIACLWPALGTRTLRAELALLRCGGNLIYALAQKPPATAAP